MYMYTYMYMYVYEQFPSLRNRMTRVNSKVNATVLQSQLCSCKVIKNISFCTSVSH